MTNPTVLVTDYPTYSIAEQALAAPADNTFLLEVTAAPFSGLDAARLAAGKAAGSLPERLVPGGHIFGKIAQIGKTAAEEFGVTAGDLVYVEPHVICQRCKYCLTGNYSVCEAKLRYGSGTLGGGFAKYLTVVPGSRVHKLPASLPLAQLYYVGLVQTALRAVAKKGLGTLERSLLIGGYSDFAIIAAAAGAAMGCTEITIYDPAQKKSNQNGFCLTDTLPAGGFDIVVDA
ncbi:MAG: alcohol dehydrogenase catalytic domain-containing protein, partial [Sporomusaceae bacterium]|nr:alcohol dehydrogenase catalytic domain-containing protein [Sporomusaceae bacterium]